MFRSLVCFLSAIFATSLLGQSSSSGALTCGSSAVAPLVPSEGLSERMGDILLSCSGGQPGASVSGNLTAFLSVNVTNHLTAGNIVDAILTIDNAAPGSAPNPVAASVAPVLYLPNAVTWNALSFTLSSSGTVNLRIANLRANASQAAGRVISVQVSTSFTPLGTSSLLIVAAPQAGLYSSQSSQLICAQNGAKLPDDLSFSKLIAAGSYFASTRVTEGFASAFSSKGDFDGLNADTGTRFVVTYSGFPAGARLVVPDYVAGSNADIPTAGGDFGVPAAGGTYTPGKKQLLLVRVNGANANGAGGTPAGSVPAETTSFDSVSELTFSNGSAYAVYEVVDDNPAIPERAQFPTWLGVPRSTTGETVITTETVALAPVSSVEAASTTAPVPRFNGSVPIGDCGLVGDCTASYYPQLDVDKTPLALTTPSNQNAAKYLGVRNKGSGAMAWSASVNYINGSGWLRLLPPSGVNHGVIQLFVSPAGLAPGTYQANIVVDAGSLAGSQTVPLTVTVTEPQPETVIPVIRSVAGAAGSNVAVVSGSFANVYGSNLDGKNVQVTFAGIPAEVSFHNPTQINVRVPSTLALPSGSAQVPVPVIAIVDSVSSAPFGIVPAAVAPAIFEGGVLNQDNTPNSAAAAAATGTVVQVFATGLDPKGQITAKVHDRDVPVPQYAGEAPGFPGLFQVNILVPEDLPTMQTYVYVCGTAASDPSQKVCSPAQKIWLAHE